MGLGHEKLLITVDFYVQLQYNEEFPSSTTVVSRIHYLSFPEIVFKMDKPSSGTGNIGRRPAARPEQKPVVLMKHLTSKYIRPSEMVLDSCFGTKAISKACLLLPKPHKLIGCDSALDCVSKMRPSLLRVFGKQVLRSNTDISESEEVQTVARR